MGSFSFSPNPAANTLGVMVEGTFSQEDAGRFIQDYNERVSKFDPASYEIVLDCTKLNVSSPDVLPMLEQCYKMYKESGFKKVVFTIAKNPILKMQLGRVARSTKLENYEITEV
jgi:anti-anti-sigma regulatory factor